MSFKRLSPDDFTVDYNPVMEPSSSGGLLTENVNYVQGAAAINSSNDGEKFKYRQFANIIQGDATSALPAGTNIQYLVINRDSFEDSIHPASFEVDSVRLKTGSDQVEFCEAGRVYTSTDNEFYLYPDIGIALGSLTSLSGAVYAVGERGKTISHVFIRAGNSEFNYSTNPSFLDKNDYVRSTDFVYDPHTYITTIGLYNDNGDLLAVAKTPKPIEKTFNSEVLLTVKLDF